MPLKLTIEEKLNKYSKLIGEKKGFFTLQKVWVGIDSIGRSYIGTKRLCSECGQTVTSKIYYWSRLKGDRCTCTNLIAQQKSSEFKKEQALKNNRHNIDEIMERIDKNYGDFKPQGNFTEIKNGTETFYQNIGAWRDKF